MTLAKKRILIFNDCFFMGGTEILLVNLLNHLVSEKIEVSLLLPNPSDKNVLLSRVSEKVKVQYIFTEEPLGLKRNFYKNLLIFFPKRYRKSLGLNFEDYDEIVCFKDCFHSIMFADLKQPKILWIQNQPFERDYTSHNLKEYFGYALNKRQIARMNASFDMYDKVICVSDSCKKDYIKYYHKGNQQKELRVLYNALDLSNILTKAEMPIPQVNFDGIKFITVIRLSYEKTVNRLILSAKKLISEGYDFRVTILGDGMEYDNLLNQIKENDLENVISMLGRVDNPFPYMKHSDWFLCPSSRESFALTLLESITLDTPVITTKCGGPEDVIGNGKYGILTENSMEGVYEGMKKVLDNKTLLPYFQSKKEECLQRFDYPNWLSEVNNILAI